MVKKSSPKKSSKNTKKGDSSKKSKSKTSKKKSGKGKEQNSKKSGGKEKQPTQKLSKEDKQLRNFFIVVGIVALLIWGFFIAFNSSSEFQYKDVEFKTIKQGDLILYKTLLPLYNKKGNIETNYRFFLRNHPKEIKDIPVPEELDLRKFVILNYSDESLCGGHGNIAIANLKQIYSVMGAKIGEESNLNETNMTCDEDGRYNYINIRKGNKTKIEETGPSCYEMTFKDCEVLEVTERYMLKMLVQEKDTKFPVSNIQNKS